MITMTPSDAAHRIGQVIRRSFDPTLNPIVRAAAIAHEGCLMMRLALVEIAAREPAGSPTRMLALDTLRAVGYVIEDPPPEGRQVTLDNHQEEHGHGTRS